MEISVVCPVNPFYRTSSLYIRMITHDDSVAAYLCYGHIYGGSIPILSVVVNGKGNIYIRAFHIMIHLHIINGIRFDNPKRIRGIRQRQKISGAVLIRSGNSVFRLASAVLLHIRKPKLC